MIDTHSHLNFKAFKNDYAEVIKCSFDNGLKAIINVGAKIDSSQRAIDLADQFENLYASVGLHPIHVHPVKSCEAGISPKAKLFNRVNDEDFNLENYQQLVKNQKVVAVGETGLDYAVFVREQGERLQKRASAIAEGEGGLYQEIEIIKNKQKEIFKNFIDLAQEKNLPMILHCRGSKDKPLEAYQEILEILKEKKYFKGVAHCFTSISEIAQEFLNLGFYIGFTGVITFAPELEEVVKFVPLNRILLETDCPFMSPEPYRRQRCEPWYVKFTAEKIAQIKKISFEKVVEQTDENAKNLFGINV